MSIRTDSAISGTISDSKRIPDAAETGFTQDPDTADSLLGQVCDGVTSQATRYAMSIVKVWSDAEEIVQESYCRLIESTKRNNTAGDPANLGSDLNSKAILFRTIRNLAIDQLRKNKRRKFEAIETGRIPAKPDSTDPARLTKLETCIDEILEKLPEQWAESLQLKVNGGLSYSEIAKVVGGTHGQVRTWIYRARKQLANELRQQGLLEDEGESE